ncbi:MAG: hypothetical protein KatS3mg108_3494 [Isosphaeraceae bacterium]|jgi:methyl-accepting chemotaxis protein WspA|nr:MAG: hypothetical protein KatS3mg108_3494 [Isosphaeraceae bacterium]
MNALQRLLPRSIAGRLTLWFLLIALLPCIALILIQFMIAKQGYEELILRNLSLLLRNRINQVESLAVNRLRETELIATTPLLVTTMRELGSLEEASAEPATLRATLDRLERSVDGFQKTLGFSNFYLLTPKAKVVYRYRPGFEVGENLIDGPIANSSLAQALRQCLTQVPGVIAPPDFYPTLGGDQFRYFTTQTVVENGQTLGIVVIEPDNSSLLELFNDFTGLGQTGETKLARLYGRQFMVLNQLRDDPSWQLKNRRLDLGTNVASAVQLAVQKQEGVGRATDWRGLPVLAAWGYAPSLDVGIVAKIDENEAFDPLIHLRNFSLTLLLLTALLAIPVAFLVARSFSRPLGRAIQAIKGIADGDLSENVKALVTAQPAPGEIGSLQSSVADMTDDLRGLMKHIQESIVSVMSTSNEIAAVARQQEQTIQEHGSSTMEVAAAVNEISATSQELLRTMGTVQASASQAGELAARGQLALNGMHNAMDSLSESTSSISSRLSVISERAHNINLAVTTITKVADQTNLLSINAAIEAEKAGEAGRGFLVVAREIRRLADQTAAATLEIERIVKEMQHSVTAGVMEMDKFNEQVRRGVDEVGQIERQLGDVIHAVQDLLPQFHQVNEGMAAQSQGADQIREAMSHLSEGAARTSETIREFHRATENLRDSINNLKNDISKFRI